MSINVTEIVRFVGCGDLVFTKVAVPKFSRKLKLNLSQFEEKQLNLGPSFHNYSIRSRFLDAILAVLFHEVNISETREGSLALDVWELPANFCLEDTPSLISYFDFLPHAYRFLQEAVNHLRMNDDTVKELGNDILSVLVAKITQLRGTGILTSAEENRAVALVRSVQEKWQNRTLS
ncbi:unnamed protein product [Hydatigera taeniaeformis]|uniref:BTB domain-containing protein n=1 Tax=Hydatigena taeniaeformis TaxID=6205 RepID=A0A0R3WPZ6_HYDTA|nr:unnamed protein product [Hydatigera taeniaeformis]